MFGMGQRVPSRLASKSRPFSFHFVVIISMTLVEMKLCSFIMIFLDMFFEILTAFIVLTTMFTLHSMPRLFFIRTYNREFIHPTELPPSRQNLPRICHLKKMAKVFKFRIEHGGYKDS